MADLPRCRQPIWVERPIPLHRSQDLPAALLHLRDRYSRANPHTIQPFHPDKQDAGRPQEKAVAHTAGMAWDIVDPISIPVTRGSSPSATVFRSAFPSGMT